MSGSRAIAQSPFPTNTQPLPFVVVAKNYANVDTKISSSCSILLHFLTLFHKFCPSLMLIVAVFNCTFYFKKMQKTILSEEKTTNSYNITLNLVEKEDFRK